MLEPAVESTAIPHIELAVETSSMPDTGFADLCCMPLTDRRLSAKFSAHGPAVVHSVRLCAVAITVTGVVPAARTRARSRGAVPLHVHRP
jgi:hypothetical protein